MIDEFLDCSGMVEHRMKLGSQALGAWLRIEVLRVSWRNEWQILSTIVAVLGGICVKV